jgi:DNA-binding MarR family transcriptional regulator
MIIELPPAATFQQLLSRLKKLTEMGLISSDASSTDGRARELSITPKTLKKLNYIAAQIRGFAGTD